MILARRLNDGSQLVDTASIPVLVQALITKLLGDDLRPAGLSVDDAGRVALTLW